MNGGIDFEEFCRFATADHDQGMNLSTPKIIAAIQEACQDAGSLRLPQHGIHTFASMLERMCLMADKDSTGLVTATQFEQMFDMLDIPLPRPSKAVT
jgi:hypothetical protein